MSGTDLKSALLKTMAFFDVLELAVTLEECHAYLYGYTGEVGIDDVKTALRGMSSVVEADGFYILCGRELLVELRKKRDPLRRQLLAKVDRWKWIFSVVPFIHKVYVCNSLALGNIHEKSDIDLFIITAPNRLFLARLFLIPLFHLFGIRRYGSKIAGRFCLSFWKTADSPFISPILPEDPYLFFWEKSLTLVYESSLSSHRRSFLTEKFEAFLRSYQLQRIERKKLSLAIPHGILALSNLLKLHDQDRRKEFYDAWQKRFQALTKV